MEGLKTRSFPITTDGEFLKTTDGDIVLLSFPRPGFSGFNFPLTTEVSNITRISSFSDNARTVVIDQ